MGAVLTWYCPDCGTATQGFIGRRLAQPGQQRAATTPKYNVKCPNCSAALVSPASENIKCPKCGFKMRVRPNQAATPLSAPLGGHPAPSMPGQSETNASGSSLMGASDGISELERLVKMRDDGNLTPEEFEVLKARLIEGIP